MPRFFAPNGGELVPVPEPADAAGAGDLPRIEDPDVNLCGWDGEPVNYDDVVDALCAASV